MIRGPDSYISWTVPADGEYNSRVRDHLNNGGSDYTYRVEFQPREANQFVCSGYCPVQYTDSQKRCRGTRESFSPDLKLGALASR